MSTFAGLDKDQRRARAFGEAWQHNHVWLRTQFTDMTIEQAKDVLEMYMDGEHETRVITDEEKPNLRNEIAVLMLQEELGGEKMDGYLARNGGVNMAYPAWMLHKRKKEGKERAEKDWAELTDKQKEWINEFQAFSGEPRWMALEIAKNYDYDMGRIEEAVQMIFKDREENANAMPDLVSATTNGDASAEALSREQNKWVVDFMGKTKVTAKVAEHWGTKFGYSQQAMGKAEMAYYQVEFGDGRTNGFSNSGTNGLPTPSPATKKQQYEWKERFCGITAATMWYAERYMISYGATERGLDVAVEAYLRHHPGPGPHGQANGNATNYSSVFKGLRADAPAFHVGGVPPPTNPTTTAKNMSANIDAGIEGFDPTLVTSWSRLTPEERINQLNLAHNLDSLDAFSWIVATPRMNEFRERYIRTSWEASPTRLTADAVPAHIARHDVDGYTDITGCDEETAKEHLKFSDNFATAIEFGFDEGYAKMISEKGKRMMGEVEVLRRTWRLRLMRLLRVKDMIMKCGFTTVQEIIEREDEDGKGDKENERLIEQVKELSLKEQLKTLVAAHDKEEADREREEERKRQEGADLQW